MKRILLTGATGMIGSAIARGAVSQGYCVTCLVRKGSPRIANIVQDSRVRIIDCDISDYNTIALDGKYDIFMHLAWNKTSVGGRDDVDSQLANIQHTLDAVRLAHRAGCSAFVGAGSQAEYGVQSVPLTPELPCNPESGYGIAKYTAGKLGALLAAQLGLRFNWLRILSVYGRNDGENTLISYVIRELKTGRSPELTPCEQVWDYLNADDAARAFLAVAERGVDGKTYPLGSGNGRRLSEYIEDIRSAINPAVPLGFCKKEYYPHQPMYLVADVTELEKDTGWKAELDFKKKLREI